ncbi:MAG: hypothetical protein HY866_20295, partial [Chloroflexi bacterium]|nr:hypothetical protein [Chloroflexota bacterium]
MMRSRLKGMLIVLALALVLVAVPAQAQDGGGLTEEESLLLDRVFEAREIYRGWSSYVEQGSGVQTREVSLKIGNTPQTQSTVATWERTSTIIRQDNDMNIQSSLAVTIDNTRFGGGVESYTVNADVRRVDQQLYVSAAYEGESQPDWPALPDGWVQVQKISDWSGFQDLNLGDYLQQATPFDNPERLKEASPTVTLETGTLDDGTPVEIITVELGVEAIQSLFNTSVVDPSVTAMIISL